MFLGGVGFDPVVRNAGMVGNLVPDTPTDGRSAGSFEEPVLDLVLRICCAPEMCWIEEPSSSSV